MAYAGARFGYHHTQTDSALDSKRAAFIDEDDSAVLDPSILDADIMQSPNNTFRKDSFANSNGVLSPAESHHQWEHHYNGGALPVEPASAGATNPYHEDGAVYMRQPNPHPTPFAQQHHASWSSFEHGSGNCTPTNGVEFMPPPPHFEAPQYPRTDSAHGSFSQPPGPPAFSVAPTEGGFIPAPQVQTPMSPHSHQDWMGMAQQEMEGRPSHKRMRPSSPTRNLIDLQRREGIRKKNGRIDIPQERNIQTIDDLIEKTTDDDMLKELKQQKRLLRNREAALASRQRKKKHTEDLEIKEKSYTTQISMLESQVTELHRDRELRERERQTALQRLQEAQRIIDTMQEQKRELVMRHNEESSNLRKKVHILTEQLEAGPAPMSATQSSTGFTDFNAEMEALNMGPHDWDQFMLANDLQNDDLNGFPYDPKPEPVKPSPVLTKKSSTATVTQASSKKEKESTDQPIASGLLFMLLLCGAFVASKPSTSQSGELPKMPADVRAVAPTVLNNLLSESVPSHTNEHVRAVARMGQEPMPSNMPYNNNPKPSRLDRMHRSITSPTKQQEIDQAFALTTAQYASITNMDYPAYGQPHPPSQSEPAPPPRRNLAEALSNLEQEHSRNNKAEVYTRSLLWDQIPVDVVRQFKEIVRDHSEIDARHQQQARRPSNDYAYKIEQ